MVKYRKNTKSYKKQRKTRKSGNGGGFFRQVFGGDIEEGTKDEEDKQGGIMGTLNKTKEGASGILGNMLGKNEHNEDKENLANIRLNKAEEGNASHIPGAVVGGKKKKGCGCSGGMMGGKKRKSRKSRKGRKTRKGGKSRKGRKSKKSKKSKKSRK